MPIASRARPLRFLARVSILLVLGLHLSPGQAQTRRFDLPAQPLDQALDQFARQASLQLVFAPELVRGLMANALQGEIDISAGLERLLDGSGLQGRISGNTLTVTRRAGPDAGPAPLRELAPVVVSAGDQHVHLLPAPAAGGQVARGVRLGVLGNTSNMTAPFSTTSYTAEAVENQQATSIAEAINRDPSVRFTVLPGGNVDNLYIRGFPIWEGNSGEIAFDGIYGIAPNYRVRSEYVDRIEVINRSTARCWRWRSTTRSSVFARPWTSCRRTRTSTASVGRSCHRASRRCRGRRTDAPT